MPARLPVRSASGPVFLFQQSKDSVILPLAVEQEVLSQRPFLNKARREQGPA